ncbi:MAG: hypothetical protein RLZZ185_944 [Bacteroidota bacterium]
MKKCLILMFVCLIPFKNVKAQNQALSNAAIVGGAALIAGVGIASSVESVKEGLERGMSEWVFANKKFKTNTEFDLSLIKWEAATKSDLSYVRIVVFRYKEKGNEPVILLNILSPGWLNDYGVAFDRINVVELNKESWGKILKTYLNLAKFDEIKEEIELDSIPVDMDKALFSKKETQKLVNVKYLKNIIDGEMIFSDGKFSARFNYKNDLNGDKHIVKDVDDNFICDFNESSMNLYYKATGDLVRIKRSFILEITKGLFN